MVRLTDQQRHQATRMVTNKMFFSHSGTSNALLVQRHQQMTSETENFTVRPTQG